MRRLLVVLLVLLPLIAFGAEKSLKGAPFPEPPEGSSMYDAKNQCEYYMEGSAVAGVTCRDKCLANEKVVDKVKLLDGKFKGAEACLRCFKKGVLDSKGRAVPSGKVACSKIK